MSNLTFHQDYLNTRPSADAVVIGHPYAGPNGPAPDDCLTHVFHPTLVDGNALGLYGMCQSEFNWAEDLFAHSSATSISNQIDPHIFNTSFSQEFSSPGGMVHCWQSHSLHYPFVSEAGAFAGAGDSPIPHFAQTLTMPGSFPTLTSTARSQSRHATLSQLSSQSTSPRSARHVPYPIESDHTGQSASPTSICQCHWSDGATVCGASMLGTRNAIEEHMQTAHGIRLKADKTEQVCHWEMCLKQMRRESIARHILAVHLQDRVTCPSCGSRFARTDSLRRHQRKQCLAKGETSNAYCKAGK